MKLVKPYFEIWEQEPDMEGIYKAIERAGRVCYSPDTEVLTDSGWKRIDNLLPTDRVVSYNPNNNTIIYDDPNLVINEYEDDMIIVNHPNIKMCITKDHRIYQSVPEKRDYTFLKAAQIAGLEKIPHSKQCKFRIPKYFLGSKRNVELHLPSIVYSKEIRNGNRHSSEVTISIPCNIDFMIIAGAFISEGHTQHGEYYGTGSFCQITQDENSELYSKVITALTNLGWNYKIYSDPRKPQIKWIRFGTNQCWVMAFDDLFGKGSKNKHLPVWFRSLPDEYLKVLISTMYLGDGSHNATRNEKYLSISKRLLDEVQEIFILLGANGTSNFNKEVSQMCYFEESHRDSWIISRNKHISTAPYKGRVYCTSTKSGIICIRYKGKTCWCGNCYKSENKTTEDSARPFVDRMIESDHGAMLEHGTVYLRIPIKAETSYRIDGYNDNPYTKTKIDKDLSCYYISTNYRVLVEHNWLDDLKYLCEPTKFHKKRITVHFILDRGVSHEFVRHRVFSFAQESTRYCNYSKDKFGNELTFTIPSWLDIPEGKISLRDAVPGDLVAVRTYIDNDGLSTTEWRQEHDIKPGGYYSDEEPISDDWSNEKWLFIRFLEHAESYYFTMLNKGWKPQEARAVLPNALKTELVMTGFVDDWQHFFDLRCAENAHPQARELAIPLREEFIRRKYI